MSNNRQIGIRIVVLGILAGLMVLLENILFNEGILKTDKGLIVALVLTGIVIVYGIAKAFLQRQKIEPLINEKRETGITIIVLSIVALALIVLRDFLVGENHIWLGYKSFIGLAVFFCLLLYGIRSVLRSSKKQPSLTVPLK